MIGFKDFLVTNPGMQKDDHLAYMSQKRKRKDCEEDKKGLWHNINQKRKRGEKMRKKGEKGAPTDAAMQRARGENQSKILSKLKKVKGITKQQMAVLSSMNPTILQQLINQLGTLVSQNEVNEKLSPKEMKKRLEMIKKAVEKINARNAEKAKKDALKMMKQSGMFDD